MGPKASVSELGSGNSNPPVSLDVTNNAKSGAKNILCSGMRVSLNALSKASGVLGPLGAAASILLDCFDTIETTSKNQQAYEDLAAELAALSQFLSEHPEEKKSSLMFGQIENEAIEVKRKAEGGTGGLLTAQLDEQELTRHYRRIQSLFQQLQASVYDNDPDARATTQNTQLELLKPAELAGYDSSLSTSINRRTCTQGTRTKVLSDLTEWANDPDAPSVFWMNGMAGTGKTTIACTFSDQLKRKGLLAASFFCTRTTTECQDVNRIVQQSHANWHDDDLRRLIERSGVLFIYAATLVRYIQPDNYHGDPYERLQTVLGLNQDAGQENLSIDVLYRMVLRSALNEKLQGSERKAIRAVLQTVLFAQEPIGVGTVGILADIDNPRRIEYALSSLRSVVYYSESTRLVSALHASFPDFMFDQARSGEYFCDAIEHDEKVEDLGDRIKANISPTLAYACRYWANHLQVLTKVDDISATFGDFLSRRLLFWMEVMSLRRELSISVMALLMAKKWLIVRGVISSAGFHSPFGPLVHSHYFPTSIGDPDRGCCQLYDGLRLDAGASINTTHLHLITSSLSSIEYCIQELPGSDARILELKGSMMDRRETASVATWNIGLTLAVAYSSDGSRVVVGFVGDAVGIYNAYDGEVIVGPLIGHTDAVKSVSFSPDGRFIASGSKDKTIRLCDAFNGTLIGNPMEHAEAVNSISFSPDNLRIVSGCDDNKIWVWSVADGTLLLGLLEGHSEPVNSVTFSPEGTLIASGSSDRTVRLWRSKDGSSVTHPLQGGTQKLVCAMFTPTTLNFVNIKKISSAVVSPDGALIVVSTHDDLQVRRINDGSLVAVRSVREGPVSYTPLVKVQENIKSLSFSVDGTHVVLGSDEATQIWNLSDGTCKPNSDVEIQLASQSSRDSSLDTIYTAHTSENGLQKIVNTADGSVVAGPFDPSLTYGSSRVIAAL
ncbi:Encoded by [Rhizoctonia solani]|uniref:Encoded by n=1 Tax=Rhizoctonia solani TaxID=456999 RepID=A0A8H7M9N4_9AGAM|nr:Encoded by [Rhizoctonia solani]